MIIMRMTHVESQLSFYKILEKAYIMLPSSVKESKFSRSKHLGVTTSETHTTVLQKVKVNLYLTTIHR